MSTSSPRLLHLGCGLVAPSEWVNVDGSMNAWLAQHRFIKKLMTTFRLLPRAQASIDWPTNVTIADLRKRLPFPDNSCDAVYSSHTIEHLHRAEALSLLKEARRVLKPGGLCRTLVPDLEVLIAEYRGDGKVKEGVYAPPVVDDPARQLCQRLMMRPEEPSRHNRLYRAYQAMTALHEHKWMYDARSLVRLMTEAGFVDCRRRAFCDSGIAHIEKVEMPGRVEGGVGVVVEGAKPSA